ncbi:MAG: ABC transporter transmembrane domain-containing protein [Hyphomicrobiales bacterium]
MSWPSPLRTDGYRPVLRSWPLPTTLFGFVWRLSAADQVWIAILTVAVVFLDTVPIEVQRRIVNSLTVGHAFQPVLLLALTYAGLVVVQGGLKLLMNIYRAWVSENSIRSLRSFINKRGLGTKPEADKAKDLGVEISIIVAEADPVGSFVGSSISSPLQQIGILISVLGYLTYLNPLMALATFIVISPQLVLVPLIQLSINRRVQKRITTLRAASAALVGEEEHEHDNSRQEARFEKVFTFNMGIFKLKYSLNFVMNLTHHLATVTVLGLGGWDVINGETEVGTVVAFVSGLSTIHDPWGDLVSWFQDFMVTSAKYDLIAGVVNENEHP